MTAIQTVSTNIQNIPTASIMPGENDRTAFNQNALSELATSIAEHGLAQPITVRPSGDRFEIVAGERRFRAISQVLEWDTVPCIVRPLSDEEASAIMLVENTSRVDLDPIAEAQAYQKRVERFGWDVSKIAQIAGVSVERVRSRLALLSLADDVGHFVKTGAFPLGHAQLIVELDINRQRIALRVFNSAQHMPLWKFREVVRRLAEEQAAESQMGLFQLEAQLIEEHQDGTARRGKAALTGAPVAEGLPPVRVSNKDSAAAVIDRYISDLMAAGNAEAAAAIGTVYNALVAGNWMTVPGNSLLAKVADSTQTADRAYVEEV